MQLSLSIMQFTEIPTIQENQHALRLEMAGEYCFDHCDLEPDPLFLLASLRGEGLQLSFLLLWHHIARNELAFPLQSTFSFLGTLKPGTQC